MMFCSVDCIYCATCDNGNTHLYSCYPTTPATHMPVPETLHTSSTHCNWTVQDLYLSNSSERQKQQDTKWVHNTSTHLLKESGGMKFHKLDSLNVLVSEATIGGSTFSVTCSNTDGLISFVLPVVMYWYEGFVIHWQDCSGYKKDKNEKRCRNGVPKVHKQGRIKVVVSIQSLIHPYIFS